MASSRRLGVEQSGSRSQLIEAASQLLLEEGYHAISARRVAERAGLKPQLVHYYFRSMDDLVIAVFRRSVEEYVKLHERALVASQPLRELWKLNSNATRTKQMIGFMAAAGQREAVRIEIARSAEHFRALQISAVAKALNGRVLGSGKQLDPAGIAMLMAAASRALVMEESIGVTLAHAELRGIVVHLLDLIEPLPETPAS